MLCCFWHPDEPNKISNRDIMSATFPVTPEVNLADVSDIFYFFSARGGGRGSPRPPGGGCRFLIENPRGGGGLQEWPRGREGVCGKLGILGGGGAKYFFSGPKCPPSKSLRDRKPMTARDVTGFYACVSARKSGNFLHILGQFLNDTDSLERKQKSTGENSTSPAEDIPRNCRFLSPVAR